MMPQQPKSHPQPTPPSLPCSDPEYIAIILAATQGGRLFPLTSEYPHGVPKHLLPISILNPSSSSSSSSSSTASSGDNDNAKTASGAGVGTCRGGGATLLQRLLIKTYDSGFDMVVIAIHGEDQMTIPYLLGRGIKDGKECDGSMNSGLCKLWSNKENESSIPTVGYGDLVTDLEFHGLLSTRAPSPAKNKGGTKSRKPNRRMHVRVVRLPEDCHGSADALRYLSSSRGETNDNPGSSESTPPSSSPTTKGKTAEAGQNSEGNGDNSCGYIIPRTSHAVVMPGDLILEGDLVSQIQTEAADGKDALSLLVQAHRRWNATAGSSGLESYSAGAAVTMLLTNVGSEDNKDGIPLKESSKSKMGLQSREEEDMEYVGLSSEVPSPLSDSLASLKLGVGSGGIIAPSRRVVLKRSKLEVEEDEGIGSTPKLTVPKRRLHAAGGGGKHKSKHGLYGNLGGLLSMSATSTIDHSPTISLHTDLHDVHLYVISNWVLFDLLHARPNMQSFQTEVLPLLISRQYRGVEGAFGESAWRKGESNRERLRKVLKELDGGGVERKGAITCNKVSTLLGMYASGKMSGGLGKFIPPEDDDYNDGANPAANDGLEPATPKAHDESRPSLLTPPSFPKTKHPYAVSAQVLSRPASSLTLRACTLPSLLYGATEITSKTLKLDPTISSALVADGSKLSTKFNSILLPSVTLGEKVQTKSCTIGSSVTIGDRSKLNNVVVMDGATIGSNVVLQNSIVGVDAKIGDGCNLKDSQVGPGAVVASGTRTVEKGEAFHV